VFESGGEQAAIVQLDTLCAPASLVARIRDGIGAAHGFPGDRVMVAATHNHAGPAIANCGAVPREDAYVDELVGKVTEVFGSALANRRPAELGFGRTFEFGVSHNRRVIMRDGTTKTHGRFSGPNALCFEGPIDPEVAVIAVRARGQLLGALVNFACHPAHHGPTGALSAGWPGVLAREMKARGCPVPMFLQGAAGNLHTSDPATGVDLSMEDAGTRLADAADAALDGMTFTPDVTVGCRSCRLELPLREPTDEQVNGTASGAQRFVDPAIYDEVMPGLIARYRRSPVEPAEAQVLFLNDIAVAAAPAEYFVEHALRIKQAVWPRQAIVVSNTNGMLGYVPTRDAFAHGGYETTYGSPSRMAPETGDLLADALIQLITA
jgi:hypothetical protein